MSTRDLLHLTENFTNRINRRQIIGSLEKALEITNLVQTIVNSTRWEDLSNLLYLIKFTGQQIVRAHPKDLVLFNVICRMIHLVRTEAENAPIFQNNSNDNSLFTPTGTGVSTPKMGLGQSNLGSSSKLVDLLDVNLSKKNQSSVTFRTNLKNCITQGINDFIEELEGSRANIASHALDHVHEIILTCGYSRTVERFFKKAAIKRKFTVIIAETAPWYSGHKLAASLASLNIETIIISDSAVFAMMSRVNKVIIGTKIVMANGGLIACAGSQMIAAAAKYHSIPVVVCASLYKLSPVFPFGQDNLNELEAPDGIFPYKDEIVDQIDVLNPSTDYVAPELIDILVDHLGSHLPSYLYRLLQENYHPDDLRALGAQL
ncbi:hypothetical protein BB561_000154 [Smittium simulii]|uniref:Translation initiation factor eIF2B subunit beta n=1 Tax=Smittium simulii TaxID=133385 RepID=A0A2T9Z098_9FUNG|nr:hypothetical protein BB561_000154 [Smittium simulii]